MEKRFLSDTERQAVREAIMGLMETMVPVPEDMTLPLDTAEVAGLYHPTLALLLLSSSVSKANIFPHRVSHDAQVGFDSQMEIFVLRVPWVCIFRISWTLRISQI